MPDPASPAPATGAARFDLEIRELGGRGRDFLLDGAGIAWTGPDGPHRRALDEITAVEFEHELTGDNPYARCDLSFTAGAPVMLRRFGGRPEDIQAFRSFVFALIERLGPERLARIPFRHGVRPGARMASIVGFGGGLAMFVGVFIFGLFSEETYSQPNEWLLLPLSLLFIVMLAFGLRASLKSGMTTFDPRDPPPAAFPAEPLRRKKPV